MILVRNRRRCWSRCTDRCLPPVMLCTWWRWPSWTENRIGGRPIILSTRIGNEESHVNIRGYMIERACYPITRTELRQLAEAGEITMTIRTHEGTIRRVFDESHKTALQEFYRRFVQNHSK